MPGKSANGDCKTAELREISGAITAQQAFAVAGWCRSCACAILGDHSVAMGREPKGQDGSDKLGEEVIGAISRRMIALRQKRGLTQEQLGKLVGVTQGRIFELEQRTSNVTVLTLVRLAQVLDVELSELMFDIPSASEMRLADALERWTKALEERTAFEKALMEEIRPIVDEVKAIAIRKLQEDHVGTAAETTPAGREGARRPPRKTT